MRTLYARLSGLVSTIAFLATFSILLAMGACSGSRIDAPSANTNEAIDMANDGTANALDAADESQYFDIPIDLGPPDHIEDKLDTSEGTGHLTFTV